MYISPGVSSTILNDRDRIKILQNPALGFSEILEEAFWNILKEN